MTALAVASALVTALCIGYQWGRRAGSTPPTWKQRTSRMALGRRAISLVALMSARRLQRSFSAQRRLEPLLLLRSAPPRRRFHRI
ncbi:hypothetical protein A5791_21955 [Mycobacterium sp. 852002-51163_SCH5372311]|uniref:hypothetical protein n=1 Tax=Mycobacterium sp. 852002-51163_SCH5372311 TaxID=1834097 RepID=UPI0008012DE2|nr:hypothetical protein [Mycobacterium sp. 852002-51163_SCH5372311]OBF85839.1 hypothetical protein A5791_21955 [Mycobacterium sp. 852002-51163_SCH5372311]